MAKQMDSPVFVTVTTNVPEYEPISCYRVELKRTTWDEVLVSNGIQMNPAKYCLKSRDRKTVLFPNEKVSSYVATYKKKMQEYKVSLTAITAADRKKIAEKGKKKRSGPRTSKSPKKMVYVRKPGTSAAMRNEQLFANSPHHGLNPEAPFNFQKYPEDLILPNGQQMTDHDFVREDFQDFDDSASQDSQDSQIGLDDIKTAAITRLVKQTPNSVMYNVREEMRNLKQKPNFLKIARYIPLTINMLSHMFQEP